MNILKILTFFAILAVLYYFANSMRSGRYRRICAKNRWRELSALQYQPVLGDIQSGITSALKKSGEITNIKMLYAAEISQNPEVYFFLFDYNYGFTGGYSALILKTQKNLPYTKIANNVQPMPQLDNPAIALDGLDIGREYKLYTEIPDARKVLEIISGGAEFSKIKKYGLMLEISGNYAAVYKKGATPHIDRLVKALMPLLIEAEEKLR